MDWYSPLFYLRIPLLTISFRFGYLCGASNELSCWLRAVKLVLPYTMLFAVSRQSSKSGGGESTTAMRLIRLACIVIGIIHIGACIWFYIGSRYQVRHTIVWDKHGLSLHYVTEVVSWPRYQLVLSKRRAGIDFVYWTQQIRHEIWVICLGKIPSLVLLGCSHYHIKWVCIDLIDYSEDITWC